MLGWADRSSSPAADMSKRRLSIRFRLPPYQYPRNEWRKAIHEAAIRRLRRTRYLDGDKLEIDVMLYLKSSHLAMSDLDNRLKDVLDALQGRAGGPKGRRTLAPIIANDSQIWRATVEKSAAPRQNPRGGGWVSLRGFRT